MLINWVICTENASTPYQATVYIGGMQYGVGHGSSKRQAKSAAARASIHILIPEMKDELDKHAPHAAPAPDTSEPDFTVSSTLLLLGYTTTLVTIHIILISKKKIIWASSTSCGKI